MNSKIEFQFLKTTFKPGISNCFTKNMFVIFRVGASNFWNSPIYAAFRLACCIATLMMIFAQLCKRHLPQRDDQAASSVLPIYRSITFPLCPPRQIADSWILFSSGVMPLGDKAKAAWPLRAATPKQQAMITRRSGKATSGKLVWNQHYSPGTFEFITCSLLMRE